MGKPEITHVFHVTSVLCAPLLVVYLNDNASISGTAIAQSV